MNVAGLVLGYVLGFYGFIEASVCGLRANSEQNKRATCLCVYVCVSVLVRPQMDTVQHVTVLGVQQINYAHSKYHTQNIEFPTYTVPTPNKAKSA